MLIDISNLQEGDVVQVKKIDTTSPQIKQKFYSMGLYPGVKLSIEHKALFGDPIAVRIDKSLFSLRIKEAELIKVEDLFDPVLDYVTNQ